MTSNSPHHRIDEEKTILDQSGLSFIHFVLRMQDGARVSTGTNCDDLIRQLVNRVLTELDMRGFVIMNPSDLRSVSYSSSHSLGE